MRKFLAVLAVGLGVAIGALAYLLPAPGAAQGAGCMAQMADHAMSH
jgi:hypothetical protein